MPDKILFIHGLASSGAYKMASMLRQLLRPAEVIAPDVPIAPDAALTLLQEIIRRQQPDLVVGMSLGGFWAQQLSGPPRVLINPSFHCSRLMQTMVGRVEWLSPRADGETAFLLTDSLCEAYRQLEDRQFDDVTPADRLRTLGCFAREDERVRDADEFLRHYPDRAFFYEGGHLPTYPQMKFSVVPAIRRFLSEDPEPPFQKPF